MRHRKQTIKLGRSSSHRAAMLANMVTSLFKHERIRTTVPKAKAAVMLADRLVSHARAGDLASRRRAARVVRDPKVLKKLFEEIGPRMKERTSGFVSVVKLWPRPGDAALMCLMELHGAPAVAKGEKAEKPAEKAPAPKQPKFKKKGEKKAEGTPRPLRPASAGSGQAPAKKEAKSASAKAPDDESEKGKKEEAPK